MKDLKLPHRIVLVNYLGDQDKPVSSPDVVKRWVSLAVVFEAMMLNKITFKDTQLVINDTSKTGHSMIDDTVDFLNSLKEKSSPDKWLPGFASNSHAYEHVLDNLKENELLVSKRASFLGIKGKEKSMPASENISEAAKNYLAQISLEENRSLRDELTIRILIASGIVDIETEKIADRKATDEESVVFFERAIKILKNQS